MNSEIVDLVVIAEEALKRAMINSDTAALDQLLADELVFVNHFGQRSTKQEDILLHQSGLLSIRTIELTDVKTVPHDTFVLVYVKAEIQGTYNGTEANGCFAFSRVWAKRDGKLQVVSVHSTIIEQ
ncbi:nuclear transport factor 2 family protein [Vibrio rhodolitus]|uniref:nuclear transport factor 2 family protein n=1 Tax=Vibrio rhodolitus TaxID=2231649 RepID=UPI000E0A3159|nr:nuclear transport factor 2 family protein [Vibrio rhodolitus]